VVHRHDRNWMRSSGSSKGILEEDRTAHRKQRHTAKRIFERLRVIEPH